MHRIIIRLFQRLACRSRDIRTLANCDCRSLDDIGLNPSDIATNGSRYGGALIHHPDWDSDRRRRFTST